MIDIYMVSEYTIRRGVVILLLGRFFSSLNSYSASYDDALFKNQAIPNR
jgi:hypothetical protein